LTLRILLALALAGVCNAADSQLEKLTGKTILLFTPHPDWDPSELAKLKQYLRGKAVIKDGHAVEAFRIEEEFNNQ
jgi:hypothetical protein